MSYMWRNLRRMEHWLLGAGVFGAFILLVPCVAFGLPLNLIGWCFAIVGVGVTVPRLLAAFVWHPESAEVLEVEHYDGGQSVKVRYHFDGEPFLGNVAGTWQKSPGDKVQLFINPERPTQYFGMSFMVILLGIAFIIFGLGVATSQPIFSAGWE